jgi:hypothetical protein
MIRKSSPAIEIENSIAGEVILKAKTEGFGREGDGPARSVYNPSIKGRTKERDAWASHVVIRTAIAVILVKCFIPF